MVHCPRPTGPGNGLLLPFVLLAGLSGFLPTFAGAQEMCPDPVQAWVVALDQPFTWNRYGAVEPQGMIYALRRDVVDSDDPDGLPSPGEVQAYLPGQVMLRKDKRPRPLVLRVNQGDCLEIHFTNLLANTPRNQQPHTRAASIHVIGMQPVSSILDDGSYVGNNASSIVAPGQSITYLLYAEREGTYLMHSMGATVGGEGDGGSISAGLFGAVNVEPEESEWYRSQVSQADLAHATLPSTSPPADDYPTIDYDAEYPPGNRYAGLPVLRMLDENKEIVHSDLTALITGPDAGDHPSALPSTRLHPNRAKPFREFTIIFHDEIGAVQAFKEFEHNVLAFTLHSARDAFAINYGTGGIGAEVLANRFALGPVHDCAECKYEEFFLTSWAVGDPAMVVDKPANFPCNQLGLDGCTPDPGIKATKALYPDDPSNVYHSYLNDRVIFRNLHAGTDDHHIFHLHAHQWTHTARSNLSSYLDSQAIGQGASFNYEIAYGGSGNRNRTPGDSIFHCHFYPHFAQGMWGLWRVHDVFEAGTPLGNDGIPVIGSRALPDGEIARGTPIPAIIPVPTIPLAPLPALAWLDSNGHVVTEDPAVLMNRLQTGQVHHTNPGFPFWVPGIPGRRPPHPPLDTLFDGGLPRHVVEDGEAAFSVDPNVLRLSFRKDLEKITVDWLDETGEPIEKVAMQFHFKPTGYTTPIPAGGSGIFRVNRGQPVRGAPFADPCITDTGTAINSLRTYKAADIQIDAVFNKSGWHFPQQRMISLLEDVQDTIAGTRPPEPLFIRARSGECVEYQLTNLIPNEYQLDDFQVRTPTDILGQHIHLVKFDVTSSDGAANGFNYEDGSFGGEEVQERLCAIRRAIPECDEHLDKPCDWEVQSAKCPVPQTNPAFLNDAIDPDCDGQLENWGAQTTVQRWWADAIPVDAGGLTAARGTRTLRTVFTHDHFGPSTHQQAGLYAGLIVEPEGSTWYHNEQPTVQLGTRPDGGPTSWQAVIQGLNRDDNFREFGLQVQDFTLAYRPGGAICPNPDKGFADFARAVNPPGRKLVGPPEIYENPANCPTEDDTLGPARPCPEAVSADDPGMTSVNYRNEPIALRISTTANQQAADRAGDLSFAYMTRRDRARTEFNQFPFAPYLPLVPYGPLTKGLRQGDPFTPLLRAHEGDRVIIRTLTGAHEEEHNATLHGLKWLFEPHRKDSGWRNSQNMGISEWFDFEIPRVHTLKPGQFADFLYKPTAAAEWQWNGAWGLIRVYKGEYSASANLKPKPPAPAPVTEEDRDRDDIADPADLQTATPDESLTVLALQNPDREADTTDAELKEIPRTTAESKGVVLSIESTEDDVPSIAPGQNDPAVRVACPVEAAIREIHVTAVTAAQALANDPFPSLVYNSRDTAVRNNDYDEQGLDSQHGPLHDPTAILFVHDEDLTWVGDPPQPRLNATYQREPLILRANKGECIEVRLRNAIPRTYTDAGFPGWNAVPMIIDGFNANDVVPSLHVALHPQLVWFDIRRADGSNAGLNPALYRRQTVAPGEIRTFYWYAGDITPNTNDQLVATPIEFGATGLSSSDPIKHANKGAVGALIVEPAGATWTFHGTSEAVPPTAQRVRRLSRAAASVFLGSTKLFDEFVLVFQDNVNLRYADDDWPPVASLAVNEDPTESGQKAVNYKTEPLWFRTGFLPETDLEERGAFPNHHLVLSNTWTGGDPETPVFRTAVGTPTRFRLVHPGGHTQAHVFDLHGHIWEELPYVNDSKDLGSNAASEWQGARGGFGPTSHGEAILKNGAGGAGGIFGDYLYRDYPAWLLDDGIWGILRVTNSPFIGTDPEP